MTSAPVAGTVMLATIARIAFDSDIYLTFDDRLAAAEALRGLDLVKFSDADKRVAKTMIHRCTSAAIRTRLMLAIGGW